MRGLIGKPCRRTDALTNKGARGPLVIAPVKQTTLRDQTNTTWAQRRLRPTVALDRLAPRLGWLSHCGLCPLCPRKRTQDDNNRDCVGRTLWLPASPRQLRRLCVKRLTGAGTLDFFAEFFGRPALSRLVNLSSTTPLQQRRIKTLFSMLSSIRRFSRRSDQKVNTLECKVQLCVQRFARQCWLPLRFAYC